jgi:hypothetical protein
MFEHFQKDFSFLSPSKKTSLASKGAKNDRSFAKFTPRSSNSKSTLSSSWIDNNYLTGTRARLAIGTSSRSSTFSFGDAEPKVGPKSPVKTRISTPLAVLFKDDGFAVSPRTSFIAESPGSIPNLIHIIARRQIQPRKTTYQDFQRRQLTKNSEIDADSRISEASDDEQVDIRAGSDSEYMWWCTTIFLLVFIAWIQLNFHG